MKKIRDLLILLAVTAAFGVSLWLLWRAVGLSSPWFALVAMFDLLGLVAVARPLFLPRMPRCLAEVRAWEVRGTFYRAMGVPAFGQLLRRTPLRYLQPLVYLSRSPGEPAKVRRQMEGAEAAHFWAAVLLIPHIVYACAQKRWGSLFWFAMVQIIGNVYPILHLRWARGRLQRVLARKIVKSPAGSGQSMAAGP